MCTTSPWQALGAQLAAARHRRALTQHHVAHHAGISQPAYSQIERGRVRPRPALLGRLVLTLSLDVTLVATLAEYPLERVLAALAGG